ncbi:MAG: hypothetical protein L0Z53_05385, partial [Acidobacteriales bacterium]|nr:hypothetical protein [Terriglobales bacterium]
DTSVFLTARQVCARYGGISDMSLWRWLHDEQLAFPQPLVISKRRYWRLGELEAWERRRAAAHGPPLAFRPTTEQIHRALAISRRLEAMPKIKAKKAISLAHKAANRGIITPELARIVDGRVSHVNVSESQSEHFDTVRVEADPIELLHRAGALRWWQYEAAMQLWTHYYMAGLDPARATDYAKEPVDGGGNIPEPERREYFRTEFNAASKSMGRLTWTMVRSVVIAKQSPYDVAVAVAAATYKKDSRKYREACLNGLRTGLDELASHYGLIKFGGLTR